jgi:hypothetical protein
LARGVDGAQNIGVYSLGSDAPPMTDHARLLFDIASIKLEIIYQEEKLKALMDEITELYASGDLDAIKDDDGNLAHEGVKITRCSRTTWQYSKAVKELQQLEQFEGVATKKETEYWRISLPKAEF